MLALTITLLSAALPHDWTQWRGPNRDGIAPESGWNSEGTELWKVNVGLGYSAVAVRGDLVYTIGFREETSEDEIVCLDADDGEVLWTHAYPAKKWDNMHEGGTLTTPVLEGDAVYVLSRMGPLWCLDAETGEVRYTRRLDEDYEVPTEPFGLNTSPVIVDDMMFLNIGSTVALDKETGEGFWETRNYGYSYGTPVPFEADGEPRLAIFNAAGLVILDRETGDELLLHEWKSKFNVNAATPIVLDGEQVFISTGYDDVGCAMLDITGDSIQVIWASKTMRNKMNGCVLFEDHLYGFDDKMLKCIDLEGNEMWRERGLGLGTVTLSDDRLIVLSEDGELIVGSASPEGFEEQSRTSAVPGGKCWTYPVLSGGRIYVRNNKGDLACRDHRPKE